MTVTVAPGSRCWIVSGTSMKQFASAIERRMPEPCGPVVRTVPMTGSKIPRAKNRSPDEELEAEERRHRVAGEAEDELPVHLPERERPARADRDGPEVHRPELV